MKRLFDLSLGLVLLVVFVIPMLFIIIAIHLTSKGPSLYWSERIGKNNIIYQFYPNN